MKKPTVVTCVVTMIILAGLAGGCANARDRNKELALSHIQTVLSEDLQSNYPPTVKEVVKAFAEIQKCLYGGECTEEEVRQLGLKARELYDKALLEANEEEYNLIRLQSDVDAYAAAQKKITSVAVAGSNNVDTFRQDGSEWARISCTYHILEKGKVNTSVTIYLLRRDEDRRWKIYGWDLAENVDVQDK